ncbi:MAG: putative phenylalanine aminotransferase [Actinomycetota bacterium]|jgi:histidinol-phosphate aminotransferase
MNSPQTREDLTTLPAYKAGQKLAAREGVQVFKLSSNENPYPPLPSVVEAISQAALDVNRYPDPLNTQMIATIAERYRVDAENIGVGTGSVAVLGHIIEAMVAPDEEVMFAWRSFEAYPIWVQICAGKSVQVPLNDHFGHDFDAMLKAITPKTRVIFVCTPNNPTGTAVMHNELDDFLSKVPSDILVVIDEAYGEFIRDTDVADGLKLFRKYRNVAVLRTFSKAYGLAGLRIGFVIAQPNIADYVRRTSIPFGVSGVAQAAVIASLQPAAEAELLTRVNDIVAERERVLEKIRAAGWQIPPQHANFFWLPTSDVDRIRAACEEAGVAVRPFPEGLRITIGESEANDRIVSLLTSWK